METKAIKPDYLFEVSWEICNKIGGIHTVVASKAQLIINELGDNYITIGPDVLRDDVNHPEFEPIAELFPGWAGKAASQGLRIKVGRWVAPGNPVAVLVDFSQYINNKDAIFTNFWEKFGLDSLSGQWDYIEPMLFGYAAGKVIDSFVDYHTDAPKKVVAQFHEWMTGSGVLYLKDNAPGIGTIFTTHATVLGRSIAGNGRPLYREMEQVKPLQVAKDLGIISKNSIERLAAQNADCFATVSDLTAKECALLLEKQPDIVTPNGFDENVIPDIGNYKEKRTNGRAKLIQVANALLGKQLSSDVMLAGIGGRYEFKNKGIDIFIKALSKLNKNQGLKREVVAFFFIPANQYGARKDLLKKLEEQTNEKLPLNFISHNLHDLDFDPIVAAFKKGQLFNDANSKVNVIFVPCYLNGSDGIFNIDYYHLLLSLDISVFPSYYEPWGYTPLESVAFKVPTICTSLSGFGLYVRQHFPDTANAVKVIDRNDDNDDYVIDETANSLITFSNLSGSDLAAASEHAYAIASSALWANFIQHYYTAFAKALEKVEKREGFQSLEKKQYQNRTGAPNSASSC
ncbi:MAG: glycosyltransferase [Bacteroidales bacterium]|nr:glycosyltransferase [Bacteroidales bacterium]